MSEERIAVLEARVTGIEAKLAENTAMTREVLDTVRAFKMLGSIAKWATVIGGIVASAYHGVVSLFKN